MSTFSGKHASWPCYEKGPVALQFYPNLFPQINFLIKERKGKERNFLYLSV